MAENLLVRGARLAAVLEFGGLAVGDPMVDLPIVECAASNVGDDMIDTTNLCIEEAVEQAL